VPISVDLMLGVTPIEFRNEPNLAKTRVFGLSVGEEVIVIALFVLKQYQQG